MLSGAVLAKYTSSSCAGLRGRSTAKPVLAVNPSSPTRAYDPFPGRTVPTIVSPGLGTRCARLGASSRVSVAVDSILPHLVLARSTYSIVSGYEAFDQLSGLRTA